MGNAGAGPPPPPPPGGPPPPQPGPPPPPGRSPRLRFLRERGGVLMLVGGLLIAGGLGVAMAFVLVLLVMQLFANIFTVPFTQELRWYGPGVFDWDPGFRNGVLAATTVGSVLLILGALRRYAFESQP